jgi:thioredoxin reductase
MNLIIVGGGTAGWLTALYLNRISPDYNITLIESEEIGILGAGEGSVPVFPYFLYNLGISEEEIIKETNATFKSGISFENWRGIGDKYMHGFAVEEPMLDFDKIVKSGMIKVDNENGIIKYGVNFRISKIDGTIVDVDLLTALKKSEYKLKKSKK